MCCWPLTTTRYCNVVIVSVEQWPAFIFTMMIAGLEYPRVAAGVGVVWSVGRIIYSEGYKKKPSSREVGSIIGFLCHFINLGIAGKYIYQALMA